MNNNELRKEIKKKRKELNSVLKTVELKLAANTVGVSKSYVSLVNNEKRKMSIENVLNWLDKLKQVL